jgi:hypothetical protein
MNFFTKKMTWTNAEFIPFKLCVSAAYLYIGSTFPEFFSQYHGILLGFFGVSLVYLIAIWVKKMKA